MTTPGEPMVMKISESGAIAGDENNPPLVGGTANPPDGSIQMGRVWLYQGTGTSFVNVPGSASPGTLQGMDGLVVDLREGYNYDIQLDLDVFGTLAGQDEYVTYVQGSTDTGATWTYLALVRNESSSAGFSRRWVGDFEPNDMRGRCHNLNPGLVGAGLPPINRLQVLLRRIDADADGYMQYCPENCVIQVTEYK